MKWISKDIEMYLGAKEYVDTAVVPLVPISFGDDMKQVVPMYEYTTIITAQLEHQFKGRMLLFPCYSYFKKSYDEDLEQLKRWEEELLKEGFKHLFYITSDHGWKEWESSLNGHLICFNTIPNDMEGNYQQTAVKEQLKQLISTIMLKWK